jgi:hypothetical protein
MIVGSASIWSSILLSVSGDGLDAKKGEGTWPSVIGKEDKTVGIVKGSAWGERAVVRGEGRVALGGGDEDDEDNLEERTVIETVRVDVSIEERKGRKERWVSKRNWGKKKESVKGMKSTQDGWVKDELPSDIAASQM